MPCLTRSVVWLMVLIGAGLARGAQAPGPTAAGADLSRHVLIVSIDGLRPDVALRADMPHLRDLMKHGSFTFWARTTAVAVTLPSHVSMLTGVSPQIHGVTWNTDLPVNKLPHWPKAPTLLELARQAGYTTALVAGKVKFDVFQKPGALDWSDVPTRGKSSDEQVGQIAADLIKAHRPNVMFVHLPQVDAVGHAQGWGSAAQVAAAEGADKALGQILEAVVQAGLKDQTLVIVTSDHGGAGTTHGGPDPRSQHIPWIISGPGVAAGRDLGLDRKLEVRIEDTCATALTYLGVPLPANCQGHAAEAVLSATGLVR